MPKGGLDAIRVLYNRDRGEWVVKRDRNKCPSSYHRTKAEAIKAARALSKRHKGELVIHNMNGRISNRDSHGNDPSSSPG